MIASYSVCSLFKYNGVSVPSQRPMHAYAGPLAGLETGEGGYDEVSVPSQRPMHAYAGPLAGLQTGEGGYDEVSVPSQRPMHAYAGPLAGLQTDQCMRVGTMRYLSHPKDQCMRMQAR